MARERFGALAEKRMADARIADDFVLFAGVGQRFLDLRDGLVRDVFVLAAEKQKQRHANVPHVRNRRRLAVRKIVRDMTAVKRDRRGEPRQVGGQERDRAAIAESDRGYFPGLDEGSRAQIVDRGRHVGAQGRAADGSCGGEAGLQPRLGIRLVEIGMGAMIIVDRERDITGARKQFGNPPDLFIDSEDFL